MRLLFWSRICALALAASCLLPAQQYDLLLRGGHVIDPANNIDAVMDVAVTGNRIAAVGANLSSTQARRTVDASGLYVLPGLVDLHAHVFGYEGSLSPDDSALPAGTTTIVDAGGSGWRTFDEFKRTVIAHAKTRVLASINIVGAGMVGPKAENNTADMDPVKTADMVKSNRDVIVGIKTAHFGLTGWTAIDRAVEAGRLAGVQVMVDDRIQTNTGRTSREELLVHMRPGDIHTHMYNDRQVDMINRFSGKVEPWILEARKRGVLFDLGHGGGSFLWPVATKAMEQGFMPDTISTDLHRVSLLMQQSDMPNCMSKMMLLGMSLPETVLRSTVNPAKAIRRFPELGTLSVGRTADIAVLELQTGVFAFKDAWPAKRMGTKRLQCVLTVRDGNVVYERGPSSLSSSARTEQIYDLLLRNGHVIDPANHRNGTMDVAVIDHKIAKVAPALRAAQARVVVDASGYYVAPGLVDANARDKRDYENLPYGVTTVVVGPNADQTPPTNMTTALSKFLTTGMTIDQAIEKATVNAARDLHRPEVGTLNDGAAADIVVLDVRDGKRVRCLLTVRKGTVVWDSEGLATTDWIKAGAYSNFK